MKKICYITIVLCIPIFLFAVEEPQEVNPYQKYVAYPSLQRFENAVIYYSSQLEEDPKNDTSRIMLSYLYLMEMDRMIDEIDVFSDSTPPNVQFNYANLLLELRRFYKAIEVYDTLNSNYPEWSCPWRHKGEAYFKSDRLEEAENALKKAIETRREHYDAYVMLAEVQEAMGNYFDALQTLETGFTYLGKDIEDPDEETNDIDVQFLYLRLLKANKKDKQAKEIKQKLMKRVPEDERWKMIR